MLCNSELECEIVESAKGINAVAEKHDFVNQILDELGYKDNRSKGLSKVVEVLSKCDEWAEFTKPVCEWLEDRKAYLNL